MNKMSIFLLSFVVFKRRRWLLIGSGETVKKEIVESLYREVVPLAFRGISFPIKTWNTDGRIAAVVLQLWSNDFNTIVKMMAVRSYKNTPIIITLESINMKKKLTTQTLFWSFLDAYWHTYKHSYTYIQTQKYMVIKRPLVSTDKL